MSPIVGITASGVNAAALLNCTSVIREPFNNFTDNSWTVVTGTIVTGRTGTAANLTGSGGALGYSMPTANRSNYATLGFAYSITNIGSAQRQIVSLRDSAGTDFLTLKANTNGSVTVVAGTAGTTYGTSAAGLLVTATYAYIEMQCFIDDVAGFVTVRVDGTVAFTATGIDTQNLAPAASPIATLLFRTGGAAQNCQFDDLYMSMGPDCTFQGSQII